MQSIPERYFTSKRALGDACERRWLYYDDCDKWKIKSVWLGEETLVSELKRSIPKRYLGNAAKMQHFKVVKMSSKDFFYLAGMIQAQVWKLNLKPTLVWHF